MISFGEEKGKIKENGFFYLLHVFLRRVLSHPRCAVGAVGAVCLSCVAVLH
jgi:hypothetical protein